jgi:hypothetical protein
VTSRTFTVVRALSILFRLDVCSAFAVTPSLAPPPGVTGFWMGTILEQGIAYSDRPAVDEDAGGRLSVSMESVDTLKA